MIATADTPDNNLIERLRIGLPLAHEFRDDLEGA
jgi:hypothetical protein